MKRLLIASLAAGIILLQGCTGQSQTPTDATEPTNPPVAQEPGNNLNPQEQPTEPGSAKVYENDVFKGVTVEKEQDDTYRVKGQAKVFEGVVNYSVEDGHNVLASGSAKASKGAPEWGDFAFTVTAKKAEPNTTLILFLSEKSAKDGSSQNGLPIVLEESQPK
ncbi:Gmad2 immunoglobulin-like domain-containing protein [Brevibacillus sp. B_LB10_24]|uniref:Gmad2 immunoglobulin-like domain-containing protein n=1 Tax=Brevibacillus sp. B_LB10_24 TaxID=3380645 RepID=UPI0038BBD68A